MKLKGLKEIRIQLLNNSTLLNSIFLVSYIITDSHKNYYIALVNNN